MINKSYWLCIVGLCSVKYFIAGRLVKLRHSSKQGRSPSLIRGSLGYLTKYINLQLVGINLYSATPNNKHWATPNKFSCRKYSF